MKIAHILLLLSATLAFSVADEFTMEEGVLVLDDDNFDKAIEQHSKLLVEFYAPWCGHCKQLAPEYAKAAQKLAKEDPPLYIAKVDATANTALASKFEVRGYPTLYFFNEGVKQEYSGGRTEKDIVSWVIKHSGPPSVEVDAEGLKAKRESHEVVVAYFGCDEDDKFAVYNEAVGADDKYIHVHLKCDSAEEFGLTQKPPAVVMFRKFEAPLVEYDGEWKAKEITKWIKATGLPTVLDFDDSHVEAIFQERKPALFLFRDEDSEQHKGLEDTLHKIASARKGQVLFAKSGIKKGIQQRLGEFAGVTDSDMPRYMIVAPSANGIDKYVYEGEAASAKAGDLMRFVDNFRQGKLKKFLKSEEAPQQEGPVVVVVGKTFEEIAYNAEDDVLIEFYAPWCGHCKKLEPIYKEFAEDMKKVPNLVIAKMDSTANEVDGVEISGFPTLFFFPKGNRNRQKIEFKNDRTLEGLTDYIKSNSDAYKEWEQKKDL